MNYNKTIIGGRIAKDLELKTTTSGNAVLTFPVAVATKHKDKNESTDFFDCVAWGQTAEFIAKYFKKGSTILVEGALHTRTYTDRDGKNRKVTEINVEKVEFVDPPKAELTEPVAIPEDQFKQLEDEKLPF
ncbi:single-stranded DNA-binding protein [Candidatus Saccharibacteria bacterium]|nr:single-stranded DNA-binding protein [Candidatus Saccharibacteria bacterium]